MGAGAGLYSNRVGYGCGRLVTADATDMNSGE
jgi:hypothetical protein